MKYLLVLTVLDIYGRPVEKAVHKFQPGWAIAIRVPKDGDTVIIEVQEERVSSRWENPEQVSEFISLSENLARDLDSDAVKIGAEISMTQAKDLLYAISGLRKMLLGEVIEAESQGIE